MINDGSPDPDREIVVKCIGKNLLPAARPRRLRRLSPLVTAPRAGNRHPYLLCHLIPSEALITQLRDLLCGSWVGRRAATQSGAGMVKLLTDRCPMNPKLGTDLTQRPAVGI
jgi:hypothetical protein